MARVVILGAGAMGSAFAFPIADAGNLVNVVGTHLDDEWIDEIQSSGIHPKLKLAFPDGVSAFHFSDFDTALKDDPDCVVLGVSSPGIGWAIERLRERRENFSSGVRLLLLTKGLAVVDGNIVVLPRFVQTELKTSGFTEVTVGGVGGPCIAAELAAGRDSSVVIAASSPTFAEEVGHLTKADYYHVTGSTDIVGVEACAALKNFYAIGIGSAVGGLDRERSSPNGSQMHNPAAALFTKAIQEMAYLVRYLGGSESAVYGLAGVGDLYVTCQAGRNSRMGRYLGSGLRFSEAKSRHMQQDTVEGADLAMTIGKTIEDKVASGILDGRELPLAQAIIDAVCYDTQLRIPWDRCTHSFRTE